MAIKNIDGDVKVEFTEPAQRQTLDSGESAKTLFGKISKWLRDLKAVAFTGSYNDLSDKPTIPSSAVTGVKGDNESSYRDGNVNITKSNIGLGNVQNKSSATIRSEITSSNVTSALGYTPVNKAGDAMTGTLQFKDNNGNVVGDIQGSSDDTLVIHGGETVDGILELDGILIELLCSLTEVSGELQLDSVYRTSTSDNDDWSVLGIVTHSDDMDRTGRVVKLYTSDIVTSNRIVSGLGYTPETVDNGVKNLLYTKPKNYSASGVTLTYVSPNKFKVTGTTNTINTTVPLTANVSTGAISFDDSQYPDDNALGSGNFTATVNVPAGINVQFIASTAIPISGSNYRVFVANSSSPTASFTLTSSDKYFWVRIAYNVSSVKTFNDDITIMIRRSEITDSTFAPYAEPNYKLTDAIRNMPDFSGLSHASIFRGKYLGSSFTYAQKRAIADGSFTDLYVGDYWTIGGVNWRIADIDYMYGKGATRCTTHHLVIVPDTGLTSAYMYASGATNAGYYNSYIAQTLMSGTILTTIANAFGSSFIMEHTSTLSNAMSGGTLTGWSDYTRKVDLMSQSMVYGSAVVDTATATDNYKNVGMGNAQLALFSLNKSFISILSGTHTSNSYWLRDVRNADNYMIHYYKGYAAPYGRTSSTNIRPYFCLKGA